MAQSSVANEDQVVHVCSCLYNIMRPYSYIVIELVGTKQGIYPVNLLN